MKKKLAGLIVMGMSLLFLGGCGNTSSGQQEAETENEKILFDYLGRPLGEQYYDISVYNVYSTYQDYYILNGTDRERPLVNMMTVEGEILFEEDIEGMITRVNDVYAAVLFATGKQLFDYAYEEFSMSYGYLYAKRDGVYTVYKVKSPFRTE